MVIRNRILMAAMSTLLVGLLGACSSESGQVDGDTGIDAGSEQDAEVQANLDADDDAGEDGDVERADTADVAETDTASDVADADAGTDAAEAEVVCTAENPATLDCDSGHPELEDDGLKRVHPDGFDAAGCSTFMDHNTFRAFEPTTWTIQGCPGETYTFDLVLEDCQDKAYPAYLTIEPVDTECDLSELTTMDFSPQTESTDLSCEELQRTHFCYVEEPHEEGGGFDWTMFTREMSGTSSTPWYIRLEVEHEWEAHFEYRITAHVPPLDE